MDGDPKAPGPDWTRDVVHTEEVETILRSPPGVMISFGNVAVALGVLLMSALLHTVRWSETVGGTFTVLPSTSPVWSTTGSREDGGAEEGNGRSVQFGLVAEGVGLPTSPEATRNLRDALGVIRAELRTGGPREARRTLEEVLPRRTGFLGECSSTVIRRFEHHWGWTGSAGPETRPPHIRWALQRLATVALDRALDEALVGIRTCESADMPFLAPWPGAEPVGDPVGLAVSRQGPGPALAAGLMGEVNVHGEGYSSVEPGQKVFARHLGMGNGRGLAWEGRVLAVSPAAPLGDGRVLVVLKKAIHPNGDLNREREIAGPGLVRIVTGEVRLLRRILSLSGGGRQGVAQETEPAAGEGPCVSGPRTVVPEKTERGNS